MVPRIVSLLPSATEIVAALDLEAQLVDVTHECDYPPAVRRLPKVTETLIPVDASSARIDALVRERLATIRALYTLNLPVLEVLRPNLIVTQALCDVCAVAEDEVREAVGRLPDRPAVVNLVAAQPDVIVIACCGFDVSRTMADTARLADVPGWAGLTIDPIAHPLSEGLPAPVRVPPSGPT